VNVARTVALVLMGIVLASGCGRTAPVPLRDDDPISHATSRSLLDEITGGTTRATPELVASLEANLQRHPDDVELRRTLLAIYSRNSQLERSLSHDARVLARRTHILWMIAHHPEIALESDGKFVRSQNTMSDAQGYQNGKSLWLAAAERPDVEAVVLANAATFFEDVEPALAISLWKRAQKKDPANPTYVERLGRTYARVLAGTPAQEATGANRTFIQNVSRELERSTNPTLLAATGSALADAYGSRSMFNSQPDPGLVSLGRAYIDRALMIDVNSIAAHRARVNLQIAGRRQRLQPVLQGVSHASDEEYRIVASMPPQERMTSSVTLAEQAYSQGNAAEARHDAAARDRAWTLARKYANDALALAAKLSTEPAAGAAVYRAHILLGMLALRAGNHREAVAQMLDAAQAPSSEELAYGPDPYSRVLVAYLLDAGERETVVDFLYRAASLKLDQKATMIADIDAIRANRLPATYRGLVTR
jgi:hypothetical protein